MVWQRSLWTQCYIPWYHVSCWSWSVRRQHMYWRDSHFWEIKIIQTSFVSAMGIPITMIVLPLFSIVANLGILNSVFASKVTLIFLYIGINIPYTTIFFCWHSSRTCLEHMKRPLQLMAALQRRHSGRLCSRWLSRESSQLRFSILSIFGMNISCHWSLQTTIHYGR